MNNLDYCRLTAQNRKEATERHHRLLEGEERPDVFNDEIVEIEGVIPRAAGVNIVLVAESGKTLDLSMSLAVFNQLRLSINRACKRSSIVQ